MRRRQPAEGTGPYSDLPARLQRFVPQEWFDYVGPPPSWWEADTWPMPWPHFKARRLWDRARNHWEAASGRGWWGQKPDGRARGVRELRRVGITPPS